MKEFKGNKGPWSLEDKRPHGCGGISLFSGTQYIGFVGDSDGESSSDANARLIAAAPAMINFIIELMDESGDSLEEKGHWSFYAMKDLIKKALGE